ncbi:LRR receptor-like serine/threonine-protein kinase EFR [Benincasa hispida]|uniref:LRR receptor-like serine/threonine-protein kinase EFR n=1 Tax=Benincasa hispida TaxID=102211 RepID=UPI001901BB32|nr:LRR receptor-like serine/threonine-protein kinase EFR [Benincasa hispida]
MRYNFCNSNTILCILLCHIFLISMSLASTNEPDRLALLDLKSRVLKDPLGIMSSWNDSTHYCDWFGVACNSTVKRVVALNLECRKLTGLIPPSLGNMTYLTEINLGDDNFQGHIPQEFDKDRDAPVMAQWNS